MSFGKRLESFLPNIDFDRMRREKLDRAKTKAKRDGFECILTLDPPNTTYITATFGAGAGEPMNRYAILYQNDNPTLLVPGSFRRYASRTFPDLDVDISIPSITGYTDVIWHEEAIATQRRKFAELIKRKLKQHNMLGVQLGLDSYDAVLVKELEREGVKVSPGGSKPLWEARMVKTQDEVECQRQLCAVIEACLQEVKESIKPGIMENELIANVAYTAYMKGASFYESTHVKSGARTWSGAGFYPASTDRVIRPGDIIYYDVGTGMAYQGYKGECYRTFSCGTPTQAQKDAYARLIDFQREGAKAIRPGATTKDIAEKWPTAEMCNLPNEDAAVGIQGGHGVGLEVHEPPYVSRAISIDYPVKIEAGMTLAIETLLPTGEKTPYPDGQAVRLEDMVYVTDTGIEWLTRYPEDEILVCEY